MKIYRGLSAMCAATVSFATHAVTTGPIRATTGASYPPSCISAPLTDLPSGPTVSAAGSLATISLDTGESRGTEPVQFTFWRVPCEGAKSALLLRISRVAGAPGNTAAQMSFGYGLPAMQSGTKGSVRLATEPNTLSSSLAQGALILSSITLVLENAAQDTAYPGMIVPQALPASAAPRLFDLNQPITVTIPDAAASGINPQPPPILASIPAYDPSPYGEARLAMPISGYNVGNYYDPAHDGEGAIVEVGDDAAAPAASRWLNLAWYTYDAAGAPTWIFGTTRFTPGARQVQVPMSYFSGGGFAGAFGASALVRSWGGASVSFPDCATMAFSYASNGSLAVPVPAGSGTRTWARLTQENGLACR